MRKLKFEEGEIIYHAKSKGEAAYLIVEGAVEIFHADAQGTVSLAKLEEGETFGEMALLEKTQRSVSAKADTSTTLVAISPEEFAALLGKMTEDAHHVLVSTIRRLRAMNLKFIEMHRHGRSERADDLSSNIRGRLDGPANDGQGEKPSSSINIANPPPETMADKALADNEREMEEARLAAKPSVEKVVLQRSSYDWRRLISLLESRGLSPLNAE